MNKIALSIRPYAVLFAILISFQGFSQVIIDSEDFEGGNFPYTYWQDGGNRCTRNTASRVNGANSIRLNDSGDPNATTYTKNIDLTPYTIVNISFYFSFRNSENGDNFFVEFSNDSGASYTQIGNYVRDGTYTNNTIHNITISLTDAGPTSFTTNSRFRFRNDSNNNNDRVFIDDILIQGEIYCSSNGNNVTDEYIGRVQLGGIDNASGVNAGGYSDFTNISTTLDINTNYTITITPTWTETIYNEGYAVWIDYNQDGDFDDTDEDVLTIAPSQNTPVSGSFIVPATALSGNTRMRVSLKYNDIPDSCESFGFGEVEDYTVNINTYPTNPEIDVTGQNISIIGDGTNIPIASNNTDFETTVVGTPVPKTFTINNLGNDQLDISSIVLNNTTDFTISGISTPTSLIANTGTTTFTVTFNALTTGIKTSTITIASNDSDEPLYTFTLQATILASAPKYTTYYENFDTNDGGWTPTTSTGDSWLWTNTFPTADETAEGSFWRNNAYNRYNNNTSIAIESPSLDFTGLQNLKFSIDINYDTEDDFDGMHILYSIDDGNNFFLLGANGDGTNWYDNTNINGLSNLDGWSGDGHTDIPSGTGVTAYSHFKRASISLSDATFSDISDVRFRVEFGTDFSVTDIGVAFDNVLIEADPITVLNDASQAPANLTNNLRVWLKADAGISVADGSTLTNWEDQAYDTNLDKEDANAALAYAPTYRDNETRNINFNPAVDLDDASTVYMNGKGGMYAKDYFVVLKSNNITDDDNTDQEFVFGGRNASENFYDDPTGFSLKNSSNRFSNQIVSHNVGGQSLTASSESYGRAYTSSTDAYENHPLIINVKTNNAGTASEIYKNGKKVDNTTGDAENGDPLNFYEFENLQYLIGIGRGAITGRDNSVLDGMLSEIISYTSTNSAINQQKILSYLALKYGTTLQASNSALTDHKINDVNYIDSNGNVIWDTNADTDFNYDIAGIGRDDNSQLNQKQSRSQNDEADGTSSTHGILTIGLANIYDTNNNNITTNSSNTFSDRNFVCWGNNNEDLDTDSTIPVDLSAGITGVSTPVLIEHMKRAWRVVETGNVSTCKIRIPTNVIRDVSTAVGNYFMLISSSSTFDDTSDHKIMMVNGDYLETEYNFENNQYITFGYSEDLLVERSIYFDGTNDYLETRKNLDLNSSFTVSAWIKRDTGATDCSIISKRDAAYTEGFDFKINSDGEFEVSWISGPATGSLTSSVPIPENQWHQVAVIYTNNTATLYIDGFKDTSLPSLSNPAPSSQVLLIAAAGSDAPTDYFTGNIDEVRIWNIALTEAQLRYLMNQEIADKDINALPLTQGHTIPTAITNNEISGLTLSTSLAAYFPMSKYSYLNTRDTSGNDIIASIRNLNTVDRQTAPLPYQSEIDGSWDDAATWTNGTVQTLPNALSIIDNATPISWNIVEINSNVYLGTSADPTDVRSKDCYVKALFVNAGYDLQINGETDNETSINTGIGLTVSHYLEIDGTLDLEGESQLVQTEGSDFETSASSGTLYRDQQGNGNTYLYNYWSSPVAPLSNSTYTLPNVITNVSFLTSGYNGTTAPANADYWIWKYANNTSGAYSEWEHVRSTGSMSTGEGFTMKGPGIATDANYIFYGQPNNGDINLILSDDYDYLVGNPYPSAIDADAFIADHISVNNGGNHPSTTENIINGALYFWDHFAVDSHNLKDYQGGYATYTLMGGAVAISNDAQINNSGALGTKIPERYIPVGQGFFVSAVYDDALDGNLTNDPLLTLPVNGGNITFKNSHRVFQKETVSGINSGSVFLKSNSKDKSTSKTTKDVDERQKIRLMFDSPSGYHRQLLVGADTNASNQFDIGYDALLNESNAEDMYWNFLNNQFIIQAVNNFDIDQTLPLGVNINEEGQATIRIEELINITTQKIYLHDKELDVYHDLKQSDYTIFLTPGKYLDRFEITFSSKKSLSIDDINETQIQLYFSNNTKSIVINNPTFKNIKSIKLYNIIGQSVFSFNDQKNDGYLEYKTEGLQAGAYIVKLATENGTLSKKVLIK